ncbi:enoyl-CoA hydratase/isomerase family protein [Olleya namhaensis]|uniref:3-hydroxyacyl-CoA dehydrogenase/enoyl-CoA hydratase n=1 Tax=Olleya namhaensis TaxID=1144750 RepID=A0A1I3R5X5_9FLAO|nr:enoyl-CoA hydratase/isomerase family protein [Olleya namhaensis]SFJ41152.1 3-hydroxyacyl-CoA dehydrogenase/enoyl-CoA hydratase [Olleya namhaensis]
MTSKNSEAVEFKNVKVSEQESVLVLEINTPPVNEVSIRTLQELNSGLNMAINNDSTTAIVITGSGSFFSYEAGSDAMIPQQAGVKTQTVIAHELFNRMEEFSKLIIAAIEGACARTKSLLITLLLPTKQRRLFQSL